MGKYDDWNEVYQEETEPVAEWIEGRYIDVARDRCNTKQWQRENKARVNRVKRVWRAKQPKRVLSTSTNAIRMRLYRKRKKGDKADV